MTQDQLRIQLNVPDLVGTMITKTPSWVWTTTGSCVVLTHIILREEKIIGWYHRLDILNSDGKQTVLELTHDTVCDILNSDPGDNDWQFLLPPAK